MTKKRTRTKAQQPPIAETPPAAPGTIDLGVSCTLHEARALRERCLEALESKEAPAIDGTHVERVDTAGLQVLVGFTIDCMERSLHFTWTGRSPTLVRGIRSLGIEALLESPGLAASPTGGAA